MLASDGEFLTPSSPPTPLFVGKFVANEVWGKWHEAQLLLPSRESFVSKNSLRPSSHLLKVNSLSIGWVNSGKCSGVSSQGYDGSGERFGAKLQEYKFRGEIINSFPDYLVENKLIFLEIKKYFKSRENIFILNTKKIIYLFPYEYQKPLANFLIKIRFLRSNFPKSL